MKTNTVKTKILQLVKIYGSRAKLAKALNVTERYIFHLQKGNKPGWRLYKDICELYKIKMEN